MFKNIGGKIKALANVITGAGIAVSIFLGIILLIVGIAMPDANAIFIMTGLIIMVFGSLLSWIGSFLLYGFGEIIDLLRDIRDCNPNYVEEDIKVNIDNAPQNKNGNVSDDSYYENFWICPQCNEKNQYQDSLTSQCPHCGWHL